MTQNLEGALDGIFQKSADLVLGNAHLRAFRMVAHEVDSVKFALRRAEAAADALVVVDIRCAASEAAPGLNLDLLFGQIQMCVLEGHLRVYRLVHTGLLTACRVIGREFDIVFVQRSEAAAVASDGHGSVRASVAVQALCCLMTGGNSVDNKARACVNIAADEDIGILGLIGELVCDGIVAVPESDLSALKQVAPLDSLTDSEDNLVCLDLDSLILVIYGRETLGLGVDCAHALLEHDAGDLAALVDEDFLGTPGGIDLDVLLFGFCDFFAARGHLIARLEAEHADLGSTETVSVSCAVDSDIAAADDNYAAVKCILAVLEAVAQILNSDMCAGCVVVLDSGASAALAADGDIERLVALLLELRYRDILADLNAALDFGAELFDDIDLCGDDILFKLVAGDAVGEHTAGDRVLSKTVGL